MQRIFIVHGWMGHPQMAWFPWLKRELESRGLSVTIPQMPHADRPTIDAWVPHLANIVSYPDSETFLIGHSVGVQTVLRYVETLEVDIGGIVSVAGFFTLFPDIFKKEEERKLAETWLTCPINDQKIRERAKKIVAIFSDNDPYVPIENEQLFKERLGAKTLIEREMGHMSQSHVQKVPGLLEHVLEIVDYNKPNIHLNKSL